MQIADPQRTLKIPKSETSLNQAPTERTIVLLGRVQGGDEDAASLLFSRYVARLAALARARLSRRLAGRIDPDDVVMSAWRSFFVGARIGRWTCPESGDLWRLLVKITLHKLYRSATYELAKKRSADREVPEAGTVPDVVLDLSEASLPSELAEVADLVEQIAGQLEPRGRAVFERLLQGLPLKDIATELGLSSKTVGRWTQKIREITQRLLPDLKDDSLAMSFTAPVPEPSKGIVAPLPNVPTIRVEDVKLHELIGHGSFSKVYRATLLADGRTCAVKYLRKHLQADSHQVAHFIREAGIVNQLSHPYIVHQWGVGTNDSHAVFIVQDLMATDLQRLLKSGPLGIENVLNWGRQAAEALNFAHRAGVIHCDLKPANLLLASDGTIRVSDFGMAQWLDPARQGMTPRGGTPTWMAPELATDCWGTPTSATDVYGLAATVYSLLTGKSPFEGRSAFDVMAAVIGSTRPVAANAVRSEVSPKLASFIDRCLARSPSSRPQTMDDFIEGISAPDATLIFDRQIR